MNERIYRVLEFNKIIARLVEQADTSLGKELAKQTKPQTDIASVLKLQDETDQAVQILRLNQTLPFGGISDIRPSIKRAEIGGVLSASECLHIQSTLYGTKNIKRFIDQMEEPDAPLIRSLTEELEPLSSLEREIKSCIDDHGHVMDQASDGLRQIRSKIRTSETRIRERLENLTRTKANMLSDAIVTIRNERYVLPVKQEYRQAIGGIVHDQSASGQTLFMEPQSVVEVNNQLSEARAKEQIEIDKILKELSMKIAAEHITLRHNVDVLSALDFIFARGKLSQVMHASMPKMNDQGFIEMKQARHPLLTDDEVVANDIILGKDFHAIVITGPNTGGKTVTLKLLGLLTLMAQSGLQVPAQDGCELAVFEDVFADIGDEQSIEQSLSTFSSHMTNIVEILSHVNDKTLVLFDELGAGTDPQEGAALAMAILDEVVKKQARVIATTHYPELKAYGYNRKGVINASVEFNVETLRPTYRLLIGVPGRSNAFDISRRLGLDETLISSAKELIGTDTKSVDHMIASLDTARRRAEDDYAEAEVYLNEATILKRDLERKWQEFEQERERLFEKAERKAEKAVEQARQEAEAVVQAMREMKTNHELKEHEWIEARKLFDDAKPNLTKKEEKQVRQQVKDETLNVGDDVHLITLNQSGTIVEIISEKEFQVQVGMMKMKVKKNQLEKLKPKKETVSRPVATVKNKAAGTKPELDLRGERYEDALQQLDKYIDDALLQGYPRVTIIHGKGTGALRQGVQAFAKRHRHIKSATAGSAQEGGSGVTIFEFN